VNKLIRLSPTGIEYGDYAWNFASGCGNNLEGKCKGGGFNCWAYSITQRFPGHYPNGFKPTIYPEALLSPLYLEKPSRILCAFMGDLFGDWFDPEGYDTSVTYPNGQKIINCHLKSVVKDIVWHCPQHTFIFLTKQPQNLPAWSPFPDKCHVGVTATGSEQYSRAVYWLKEIEAKVKYISLEPLLERIQLKAWPWQLFPEGKPKGICDGVIIGACTGTNSEMSRLTEDDSGLSLMEYGSKWTAQPKIEWVREIVEACDKAGVPVFLKNNLVPLFNTQKTIPRWATNQTGLRQEMPNVERD